MSAKRPRDVFVDLREATVRSAQNFHRLEHLGRFSERTLNEETVTDLLLAQMAGHDYVVTANCPDGGCGVNCAQWSASTPINGARIRVRGLTKADEGGNATKKIAGAAADFVISIDETRLDGTTPASVRLLIQAKRVNPSKARFLPRLTERQQYDNLLAAAKRMSAVPMYALYVQQPTAHHVTRTRCTTHTTSADGAIVLVGAPDDPAHALPGRPVMDILRDGWPLPCFFGCADGGGVRTTSTLHEAVRRAVDLLPHMPPTQDLQTALPADVASIQLDAGVTKPARQRTRSQGSSTGSSDTQGSTLVVKLGEASPVDDLDRDVIGYSSVMSRDQLREASRRYWVVNGQRAQQVTVLAAVHKRQVVGAWSIRADGVTLVRSGVRGYRVAFDIAEFPHGDTERRTMAAVAEQLESVGWPARNPVRYLPRPLDVLASTGPTERS